VNSYLLNDWMTCVYSPLYSTYLIDYSNRITL